MHEYLFVKTLSEEKVLTHPPLVRIMACGLVGAKPLSEPMIDVISRVFAFACMMSSTYTGMSSVGNFDVVDKITFK